MKKKIFTFLFISSISVLLTFAQKDSKNIFGLSFGFSPGIEDAFYVDFGAGSEWPDKKMSPVLHLFYARQVSESFRIGSYFEYENTKFDIDMMEGLKASRYNFGINWLGQYPKSPVHLQLGGYLGSGLVNSDMIGWDKPVWGMSFGMMAGPAYEMDNLGIALHVQEGFDYYHGEANPEWVLLWMPKFLLKVYYKL